MKKQLYITLSAPAYKGAPYPKFDKMSVNESAFEDCVRAKSWSMCAKGNDGYVSWISQETDYPTEAWENEVKRAFKANGFEGTVHVRFGSRMKGIHLEYDLQVN